MRTHRIVLLGAGLAALGLVSVAVVSVRMRSELLLEQEAVAARRAVLKADLRREAEAKAKRNASAATAPTGTYPAETAAPTSRPVLRAPSIVDLARESPGLWNEWVEAKRAELSQRYGPLFESLGLTPAQRARFKDIMAGDTARYADIAAAADEVMVPRDDPAIATLEKQSIQQTQTELAALLGERGVAEYEEYKRTIAVRGLADGLAVQLAGIAPVTATQAERLTRVLAESSAGYRKGGNATMADVDWRVVDEEARAILTGVQFEIWREGTAHNVYGGSRQEVEFKKLYEQTFAASKTVEKK